jgi:hypothetical protein
MHHGGLHLFTLAYRVPRGICTPPPCMTGFSAFAPPCMVAGPNGLDLKKIQMRIKFKICLKFGLKIKIKIPRRQVCGGEARVSFRPSAGLCPHPHACMEAAGERVK